MFSYTWNLGKQIMVSILIKIKCLTCSPLLMFSAMGLLAKGSKSEMLSVIYVSTRGHWDCTTLMHFCIGWGEAEGCRVVLKGGTISMPMGRHVDSDFVPGLKTNTDF